MKMHFEGRLVVDQERGVVYFHDCQGRCLLRLEGLQAPDPKKAQIDVRLRPFTLNPRAKDLDGKMMAAEVVR